ncbi:uncharacterized protein LTR77_007205 [Saxophila tyrrhenica]|uniref:Plasma membrane proteolipid 3 n=1 Tax=Saxophila tyrrhenica TaxID=1690608 RepID=A0AAV9P442_9PEZI|nr:hypothetical protein LTR77_007205 [Saxophila tyrrhenica]
MIGGLLLGIIAIFLPPLAVVLRTGCGADVVINILLCFLAWIPGVLHAWYVIIKTPNHSERRRIARKESRSTLGAGRRSSHGHGHAHGGYYPAATQPAVVQTGPPPPGYAPVQTTGYTHARKY